MQKIKQFSSFSGGVDQRQMSKERYNFCLCFRRMFNLNLAEPPEDIVSLFNEYSDNELMTIEHLHKFLVEIQGQEKATLEDAQAIFDSHKHLQLFQRRGLHLNTFFKYLFGDLNPPLLQGVRHDMNAPLAHYFLYTGHNSYLTGNQLSSSGSIKPIIRALRNGVRVIELDLWPNKKADDVKVCHGGTLTSPVKLIKCLEAIKQNAFYASDYPVIITFEDHLTPPLRKKVAQMVTATFGNMLASAMGSYEFLSPEHLKGKILISTKPPEESLDSLKEQNKHQPSIKDSTDITILQDDSGSIIIGETDIQAQKNEEIEEEEEEDAVPEYRDLIAIHAKKLKGGLQALLKDDSSRVSRLSMSEEQLKDAVKTHGTDIIRFTRRNLLRVYPKGGRIFSSNYDPLTAWTHGAQMVAFNMQGLGKNLSIMQGMFRANGGCGYVKKPDILLNNENFNPRTRCPVKKTLKVKVYMGDGWHLEFRPTHFDPLSPPDFFTKLEIVGVPADKKKEETMPIEDQWVPSWNQDFKFELSVPQLALLLIEVREYDMNGRHDFAGRTCLPISELQTGIRAVPLYNRQGEKYKHAKLLIRFHFSDQLCELTDYT